MQPTTSRQVFREVSQGLSIALLLIAGASMNPVVAAEPASVIDLWPDTPPGPSREVGEEQDFTKDTDTLIAGRRIIKLGNVSVPQAHVFLPPEDRRSGAAVVVCPGGGYSILAWDLEGTEVADWLTSLGVAAIVLKYRVPTREQEAAWLAPLQDAQRTLSLTRQHAEEWGLDADRIGILGFSAGGDAAARTALAQKRHYEAIDAADEFPCNASAAMLIYPGYLVNRDRTALQDDLKVTEDSPPMFLAHAFDDGVPAESSVLMFLALKKAGVPSELHVYDAGGHGYGLREVDEFPVTTWNHPCAVWLKRNGWTK